MIVVVTQSYLEPHEVFLLEETLGSEIGPSIFLITLEWKI